MPTLDDTGLDREIRDFIESERENDKKYAGGKPLTDEARARAFASLYHSENREPERDDDFGIFLANKYKNSAETEHERDDDFGIYLARKHSKNAGKDK